MSLTQSMLEIRFGYGMQPGAKSRLSAGDVLARLKNPDPLNSQFQRPSLQERMALLDEIRKARRAERDGKSGGMESVKSLRRKSRMVVGEDIRGFLSRAAVSNNGFRERLVAFWADHFTVSARSSELALAVGSFIDDVIRPNMAGSFSTLLKEVVTHPAMLYYLDQHSSVGPNSKVGKRRKAGLNENLAREILELHTMGVGAGYSQKDVRQFAELLTGMGIDNQGFKFFPQAAEPGVETILGGSYGGGRPKLDDIMSFLDDLSLNKETARHIATKLSVHFISENPPADLVSALEDIYLTSGGNLMAVYEVLLSHPASSAAPREKVKWPSEYVVSTIRALGLADELQGAPIEELGDTHQAMLAMGQELFSPPGPDGWSEAAADWITPPTLAARIEWGATMAREYGREMNPALLLQQVLGELVSDELKQTVARAEEPWEGVALLLVSPEFNRR